jgi:hypothetical protein
VASSRRGSERWAAHAAPATQRVEVLIPTAGRRAELAVTLAGLASQDDPEFAVVISDQSTERVCSSEPSVRAMVRVLEAQGRHTRIVHHETARLGKNRANWSERRESNPHYLLGKQEFCH